MNFDLYDFREQILQDGIIYSYCGSISHELIEVIAQTLRTQTKISKTSPSLSLKLFSVFVEMSENISHYSLPADNERSDFSLGEGIIVVGKQNDNYFLRCGNFVVTTEVAKLKGRLENLQNIIDDENEEPNKLAAEKLKAKILAQRDRENNGELNEYQKTNNNVDGIGADSEFEKPNYKKIVEEVQKEKQ